MMLQHFFNAIRFLISVKSDPLDTVAAFKYLGCMVAYNNSDWEALYQNLPKARIWWTMVGKVVLKTGAMMRAQGILYEELIQSVLL